MNSEINTGVNLTRPMEIAGGISLKKCNSVLDAITTIALHALNGLDAYDRGELSLFDPCVGDESCQIRALMMLKSSQEGCSGELLDAKASLESLIEKVKDLKGSLLKMYNYKGSLEEEKKLLQQAKTETIRNASNNKEVIKKINDAHKMALEELAKKERDLDQALAKEVLLAPLEKLSKKVRQIVLCYLVTQSKFVEPDEKDPHYKTSHDKSRVKQLQMSKLEFDAPLFECVLKGASQILNKESVEFLMEESSELSGKRAGLIQYVMQQPLSSQKKDFNEVSFYHGCELVMKRARDLGMCVLVKSRDPSAKYDQFSCMQLYAPIGKKYAAIDMPKDNPSVLVIEGVSQKADDLGLNNIINTAGSLMKMVRLNLAQHRFCTGRGYDEPESLLSIGIGDNEVNKIKAEKETAIQKGYGEKNMSGFRIEHMYADNLAKHLK